MDRGTPFSAGELFWSHRVLRRDRSAGKLWVRLQLLPRSKLAHLLETLDRLGLKPHRAEFRGGSDPNDFLSLDSDGGRGHRPAGRSLLWAAAACCIALALGAAVIPFIRQELELV